MIMNRPAEAGGGPMEANAEGGFEAGFRILLAHLTAAKYIIGFFQEWDQGEGDYDGDGDTDSDDIIRYFTRWENGC